MLDRNLSRIAGSCSTEWAITAASSTERSSLMSTFRVLDLAFRRERLKRLPPYLICRQIPSSVELQVWWSMALKKIPNSVGA